MKKSKSYSHKLDSNLYLKYNITVQTNVLLIQEDL